MEQKNKKEIKITYFFAVFVALLIVISLLLVVGSSRIDTSLTNMQDSTEAYIVGEESINQMREVSDYLTEKCQAFIATGNVEEAEAYYKEVDVDKRREASLAAIEPYGKEDGIYTSLANALKASNELAEVEGYAMCLAAEGYSLDSAEVPKDLTEVTLTKEDSQLPAQQKRQKARNMVFDQSYEDKKSEIWGSVLNSTEQLMENTRALELEYYESAKHRIIIQNILMALLLGFALIFLFAIAQLVLLPLGNSTEYIRTQRVLPVKGAAEYTYLAKAYNTMLQATQKHHEILSYEATHDVMTDLYNRKFFDNKREELFGEEVALMIVDVDFFKSINDTYGHEMGDKVLQKVAQILSSSFRSEDFVCRIGGDEFAVLMVQMRPELKHVVESKIAAVNEMLHRRDDGLPDVTLSIGVAFSSGNAEDPDSPDALFKTADLALYRVKEAGRDGFAFYEDKEDTEVTS